MSTAAPADPFVHPALFYRGDRQYVAGTVPFVLDGLSAGEPVAVAVPGPQLKLMKTELGADADQVHFLDMTQAGRNPGRIIPESCGPSPMPGPRHGYGSSVSPSGRAAPPRNTRPASSTRR
uniref:MEDS domain-containing protein n=1 Tax=Streptomyces avermitilis TaxID=33903 RepID=A0A499VTK5_STRAX|nr:hypothetical protein SAVMC3_81070 [Streptomyces avermitilis]